MRRSGTQGLGLRGLAHHLNADGLESPRGKGWAPTAIREILRHPIYRGERIWNRSYWVKDHEAGTLNAPRTVRIVATTLFDSSDGKSARRRRKTIERQPSGVVD